MNILAIETSCDETGLTIAEVEKKGDTTNVSIIGDVLLSQAMLHAEYGGVYPSLAKREHAKNIAPLFTKLLTETQLLTESSAPSTNKEALAEIKEILEREPELFVNLAMLFAQIKKPKIDAIAVTHGPGLEPALWVGVNFARALSRAWDIPIIPINHMEGHVAAAIAKQENKVSFTLTPPKLPALALLISGGHTELVLMKDLPASEAGWLQYEKIGATRDDAVGEAFDKSARLLGLPYPGGPEVSKLAEHARQNNLEQPYSLPRPMINTDDYDFSFSGLKTAMRTLMLGIDSPTDEQKQQIARELEDAISDVLLSKTKKAIDEHSIQTLVVSGGVSANTHLRRELEALAKEYGIPLLIPAPDLATDNGRMIALAGSLRDTTEDTVSADGNLSLEQLL